MVAFMSRKSESKTEIAAPSVPQRLSLFGPRLLLEGEDAAAYDQLLGRICAAVQPADVIDEIFIIDVVSLEWDILRWRRLKRTLIRARGLEVLKYDLARRVGNPLYSEEFAEHLAGILDDNVLEEQADSEASAGDKINKALARIGLNLKQVENDWRAQKMKELAQPYLRHERDAVTQDQELLTDAGESIDTFMAKALAEKIDIIERIDRLTTVAESRRNAALREIERRRAVFGERLRRSVQEIEDGEFEVIEPTAAEGKNAA
jgi:hypothetical protein